MAPRVQHSIPPESPQHILALSFDSEPEAHEALHAAWRMHEEHQVELHDVVVVSAEHGPAKVIESLDPTPVAAAVPSALLGALIGAIIGGPLGFLIGGAAAGATGALVVKVLDTGIPHRLVSQLRRRTKPGQATVALLVTEGVDELRHLPGAHVVYET